MPPVPAAQAAVSAYDRSVVLAKTFLEQRPNDPMLMTVLADVHFRWGRFKDAIAQYEQVLRVKKDLPEPLLAIAEAYSQLEEYPHAVEHYKRAAESGAPQTAFRAKQGLANVYFKMGRYSDAASEYRELRQALGDQPELIYL